MTVSARCSLQANLWQVLTGNTQMHCKHTHTHIRLHTDKMAKEEGLSLPLCWEWDCSVGSPQPRSGCSSVWRGNTQWTRGREVAPLCPRSEPKHRVKIDEINRKRITEMSECVMDRPVCLMVPSKRPVMQRDYSPVEGCAFIDLITKEMFTSSLSSEIQLKKIWKWQVQELVRRFVTLWHTCGWQLRTGEYKRFGSAVEGSTPPVLSVDTLCF